MLALVAVALALATGCGEDTEAKNNYVDRLNQAQLAYVEDIGNAMSSMGVDFAANRRALTRATDATEATASRLEKIEPPEGVGGEHSSLVGSLEEYAQNLRKLRSRLREDNLAAIQASVRDFADGSRRVSKRMAGKIAAINAKLQGGG